MKLVISPCGQIRCIYDETIDSAQLGSLSITRASSVEPDENGQWWADLGYVEGPLLGPFTVRSQALTAERNWLELNWLW
jgi:hypothetical protein